MGTREKIEYLLEQMRLALAIKDFAIMQVISKKVMPHVLDSHPGLKITFYQLMTTLSFRLNDFIGCARNLLKIYTTNQPSSPEKEGEKSDSDSGKIEILKKIVICAILSSYDNEQHDLIHRLSRDGSIDKVPQFKYAVEAFKGTLVINYSEFEKNIFDPFYSSDIFSSVEDGRAFLRNILKERITEHVPKHKNRCICKNISRRVHMCLWLSFLHVCGLRTLELCPCTMREYEWIVLTKYYQTIPASMGPVKSTCVNW